MATETAEKTGHIRRALEDVHFTLCRDLDAVNQKIDAEEHESMAMYFYGQATALRRAKETVREAMHVD